MDDMRIRPAMADDLDNVRRLLVETWHDTYDDLIGDDQVAEITDKWHAVEVLGRQLALPDTSFLVAEAAQQIVGHAMADAQKGPALLIARLYVLPSHQRRGIGARLLAAVIGRHPHSTSVQVNVEAANLKGVSFYRRQGFAVAGEATVDGVPLLHMEKALGR